MSAQPKEPLVSVIMANRNGAAYLDAAISSVLRQTLQAVELVIADDASTDGSMAIAQSAVARDNRVKLVQCARASGPGAARNRALNAATGHYVAVVDADDVIHPRRLETLVDYAAATDAPLVADDLIHFSTSGAAPERLFGEAVFDTPTTVGVLDLLEDRFMGGPNRLGYIKPVIQRSALGDLRYNEDLPVGEDFDLLLRFAHHGHGLHILPEAFYLYRRHTASVSHRLAAPPARAMADALRAFKAKTAPHAPVLAKVLDGRIARMERTAREAEILDRLKARRLAAAFFRYVAAPDTTTGMARALIATTRTQWRMRKANPNPKRPLLLVTPDTELPAFPPSWDVLRVLPFDRMTHDARAEFVAQTADEHRPLVCLGALDNDVSGLIPAPERIHRYDAPTGDAPVVHVRMPTYKRPEMLRRALECLQSQTMPNWVCDVFDDDPDAAGADVVAELADHRIRYHTNRPQKLASGNIDQCFTRFNPLGAQYFYVLEDDNQILPRFFEDNIHLCRTHGTRVLLRNQLVEHASGTDHAHVGDCGLLDEKLPEGLCPPDVLHLSVMADMGVSNGGIFWAADATSDLEIGLDCNATLQEYLRTLAIIEPVYVALEPLAIWAENGTQTKRDRGDRAGWLRRELNLKRSVQIVQRRVWAQATPAMRRAFLGLPALQYPAEMRATGLVKSLSTVRVGSALSPGRVARLVLRGLLIRLAGRPMRGLDRFIADRMAGRPLDGANVQP